MDKAFNPISHGNPTIELRTDASKKGWGVYFDGDTTQGLWSVSESQLHINELELKAVHSLCKLLATGFKINMSKYFVTTQPQWHMSMLWGVQNRQVVTKLHVRYGIGV